MAAAVDLDVVGEAAGDVQLTVEIEAHVARAQPVALDIGLARMAFRLSCTKPCVKDLLGVLRATPVAAPNIVALQPYFADVTVWELIGADGIDDHPVQTACQLTAGNVDADMRRIRIGRHRAASGELSAIEICHGRFGVRGDVGDEQCRLGDTVGRLERRRR
ncbi:Uncharacterised protein [Mycobacteroides abscessus subsp. abscessus]|nr:Uncharacterised protein [Mycobacteroides abscessus subsp. abscessus]